MHAGKNFSLPEVITWTRRDIFSLLIIATIPTFLYVVLDWKWLSIPWLPIALLGTAVAFVVGFANNASYDRMWEARKSWGAIVNSSRAWGIMVRDYITNKHATEKLSEEELKKVHQQLVYRHLAWLTALRYQLREPRVWEAIYEVHNQEYKNKYFTVEEQNEKVEDTLGKYLSAAEMKHVLSKTNRAAQLIAMQSEQLKELLQRGLIEDFRHMELQKQLIEFYNQQGVSERVKNFPYPRQYATLNLYFIKIFSFLLPLGMLQEFDKMGENFVWLSVPFSALAAWVFTTMEKIGKSTENPFEGSANDVPITAMSRSIEIDLREMLNETGIPAPLKPINNILT
ncbi:MAG: bestrophin family ion channel [Bacteroidota bacterium]